MNTATVDINYRPLRIAWAIKSDDMASFRHAVRLSHTMWGGRFNPIVLVDKPNAKDLVETYRADVIVPLGESDEVKAFPAQFPHLINPFFPDTLFFKDTGQPARARVLDVHNAMVRLRGMPVWKDIAEKGLDHFAWDDNDPLADVLSIHLGAYPATEVCPVDYGTRLSETAYPTPIVQTKIESAAPLDPKILNHQSISLFSRFGLTRHYAVRAGWDYPGVFFGDASSIVDLTRHWNLRACDIWLFFYDPNHAPRFSQVLPEFEKRILEQLSGQRQEHRRQLAVWADAARIDEAVAAFPREPGIVACRVTDDLWRGGVRAPVMIFGSETSLGVMGERGGKPSVSFAYREKPFVGDRCFYSQHLVASVSIGSALFGNTQYTYRIPYVPELNEFYAREMLFHYNKLRVEPERIGLIIDAADHDNTLDAMPVSELATRVVDLAGIVAKPSPAGLVTRQLLASLGGPDGARAFKIPGVRRLLRSFGLRTSVTKREALNLIGSTDPDNPGAKFNDHDNLYIEARPIGSKLTAQHVFEHLVGKKLFRIGAELDCPTCNLTSWFALDQLKQENVCEYCGATFDATRQLVGTEFRYRRTGILGFERNSLGAVPVSLLLQQLMRNFDFIGSDGVYLPSFSLSPKAGVMLPTCETDFVVVLPRNGLDRTQVVIGECKDRGGTIDANDVANMRAIADAFPKKRFDVFILFAKLSPFAPEESFHAKTLNAEGEYRVMLLTDQELEPDHLYERRAAELGTERYATNPEDVARVTHQLYFMNPSPPQQ